MANVLVVANRTALCDELEQALTERAKQGEVKFTLVIPGSGHGFSRAADPDVGIHEAEEQVERVRSKLEGDGLDVEVRVGDPDPVAAVQDAANQGSYDELIVSTLPTHLSKWLRLDLPRKAAHATGLPVTHVVGSEVK